MRIQLGKANTTTEALAFGPAIPILEIYSKDTPLTLQKYIYTRLFIAALF